MKHLALVAAMLLSCNIAAAQATTAPADTKLPPVTVEAPKKAEATNKKWSKCDFDCRMKIVNATLEKNDCREDLGVGFRDKKGQAVIMRIPAQDALEARVEELCKEFIDKADKVAEDLQLDEPAAPATATTDTGTKVAGGYGHGPRFEGRGRDRNGGKYRSFENVAEDSYTVRAKGKDFNLRNVGNGKNVCEPPRQLVRSERCVGIGGGGIRCQFDCL